ncbi:MAG: hypothetical protein LM582_09355 [Desulfurococcaceae archaeon]|nr:hypothetical protein [Desulfurococcaceae archaeon]MCC6057406.1 hypothetical protein [Desulfurococcaceae archaeon]
MTRIKVRIYTRETGYLDAELFDDFSPITFKKIIEALPTEGVGYRWAVS